MVVLVKLLQSTECLSNVISVIYPKQVMSFSNANYWIGLTDMQAEGTYVWNSGQPLSAEVASHWATTEPDDANDQDCIKIWRGALNDMSCRLSSKEIFICQKRSICMILNPSQILRIPKTTAFLILSDQVCLEEDISYSGNDNNNGWHNLQPDVEHCKTYCRSNHAETLYFSWVGPTAQVQVPIKSCWCKTSKKGRKYLNGIISGRVDCN